MGVRAVVLAAVMFCGIVLFREKAVPSGDDPQRNPQSFAAIAHRHDVRQWRQLLAVREAHRARRFQAVPATRNPAEALADESEIEFFETPLDEALSFLSDLHHVQIVLDPRVDRDSRITARLTGKSLDETLTTILRPIQLQFTIADAGLRVVRATAAGSR